MTTFPHNPARALKIMEIGIELELVNGATSFGQYIHQGVKEGKVMQAIQEIYEQSLNHRNSVADIVGNETLIKIEKLLS